MAWHVPLDQWNTIDDWHKGKMLATWRMDRLVKAWESYIQQPA